MGVRGGIDRLFGMSGPLGRRAYATTGLAVLAVKLGVEEAVVRATTGQAWLPSAYLPPLAWTRGAVLAEGPDGLPVAYALWSLPFLWIGFALLFRRLLDAGESPWMALLLFVPVLNLVLLVALCFFESRPRERDPLRWASGGRWRAAGEAALLAQVAGGLMIGVGVYLLGSYGALLFVATPFAMGLLVGWRFNRDGLSSPTETRGVVAASMALSGGLLLVFGLEGIICMAMALPLAIAMAWLGAPLGRELAATRHPARGGITALLVLLPVLAAAERSLTEPPLERVDSAIEIDAPPDAVWPQVVAVSELPPPSELVFRLGIAYPTGARIDGEGVGAVRRCEFSTGPFVEPITVWDPPRRLAFDVAESPPPMVETSLWNEIHPPHLDGAFQSRRGEFRLVALDGGTRTRLEGTTWYQLDMGPAPYWQAWTRLLVGSVHERVLDHIRAEVEGSAGSEPDGRPDRAVIG